MCIWIHVGIEPAGRSSYIVQDANEALRLVNELKKLPVQRKIIEQHNLIDQLQLQISVLEKKLKAAATSNIAHESEETPPPHLLAMG